MVVSLLDSKAEGNVLCSYSMGREKEGNLCICSDTEAVRVRKGREILSVNIHKCRNRYSMKNNLQNTLFMSILNHSQNLHYYSACSLTINNKVINTILL